MAIRMPSVRLPGRVVDGTPLSERKRPITRNATF